jgi:hypothetical protein
LAISTLIKSFGLASIAVFWLPAGAQELILLDNYSFKYSALTSAPKEVVWNLWTDVKNWKQFDERIQYSYLTDTELFELGSRGVMKGRGAPETAFEVIQLSQNESFTLKLELPLSQSIELQRYFETDESGQTLFTHEVNFRGGLKPLYYLLLSGSFKSDLKLVVDQFQAIADRESSSP